MDGFVRTDFQTPKIWKMNFLIEQKGRIFRATRPLVFRGVCFFDQPLLIVQLPSMELASGRSSAQKCRRWDRVGDICDDLQVDGTLATCSSSSYHLGVS